MFDNLVVRRAAVAGNHPIHQRAMPVGGIAARNKRGYGDGPLFYLLSGS
jgi:hypothetical protein